MAIHQCTSNKYIFQGPNNLIYMIKGFQVEVQGQYRLSTSELFLELEVLYASSALKYGHPF
jgi:hypothetical protein